VRNKDERLRAFCSITLDNEFVVRDIKVIQGPEGYFVAMPSRKMSDYCGRCGGRNPLGSRFCSGCGCPLTTSRPQNDYRGKARPFTDIAHPINRACRTRTQGRLVTAFKAELERSK